MESTNPNSNTGIPEKSKVTNSFNSKVIKDDDSSSERRPTNLTGAWREFMLETSLHGCNHIMLRRHRTKASCIWILLVVGMGTVLSFVLVQLFLAYRQHPFKTTWSVSQEREIALPSFTFCLPGKVDMTKLDNSSFLHDFVVKRQGYIPFEYFFNNKSQMDDYQRQAEEKLGHMTMASFSNLTAFDVKDVFVYITNGSHFITEDKERDKYLRASVYAPYQACWTFNWNASRARRLKITYNDRLYLLLDAKTMRFPPETTYSGIDFSVHDSSAPFSEDRHYLEPGTFTQINFRRVEHRYLPLPYKSFGSDGCMDIDSEHFENPLRLWPQYRYSRLLCIFEKMAELIIEICQCVQPVYKQFFTDVPECSFLQMMSCVTPTNRQTFKQVTGDKNNGCLKECSYTSYDVLLSNADFPLPNAQQRFPPRNVDSYTYGVDNRIFVCLKPMEPTTRVIEHVPEMTLLSVFGTVGGYMGLFLGASLLTLTEFFETLLICFWLVVSRAFNRPLH